MSKTNDILDRMSEDMTKEFGNSSIQRLSSAEALSNVTDSISTGNDFIDHVILGGRAPGSHLVPMGRMTELAGLPGVGKTTLAATIAAKAQQQGVIVLVLDTEERVDGAYWSSLGVDLTQVLNIHAETSEDSYRKIYHFLKSSQKKYKDERFLIIWDSISAKISEALLQSDDPMSNKNIGINSRVNSQGLQLLNQEIAKSRTALLFTNHLHQKIGADRYADQFETAGGQKLKYFCSLRLRLTPSSPIKDEENPESKKIMGKWVWIESLKNSMAPKLLKVKVPLIGGEGYNNDLCYFEYGKSSKLIKAAAWSSVELNGEELKFQGYDGFLDKVVPHPGYEDFKKKVLEAL